MMIKKALVTGASEGIGRAFAMALAKDGYMVMGVARNETKLKSFVSEMGTNHRYIVADLSTDAGQTLIAKEIETGGYDLLINNAGIGVQSPFQDTQIERLMQMMHLNCDALVKLSHAFVKNAKSGDALINVSSTLAFMPMPSMGLYCATKSFVTAFTETLWYEQKSKGVYVMGLSPGTTDTAFQVTAGGRKEDLPVNMAQSPEQVVEVALKALRKRSEPTIISGPKNAVFASFSRILPRKALVKMTGKMMKH